MTKMMTGVMSVLENNPQQVVLIAPPTSRRVTAFQNSLQQINWPPAKVIGYNHIIEFPDLLKETIAEGDVVRIETSGECCTTDRFLLQLARQNDPYKFDADIADLQLEQGEIIPSNHWYAGLQSFFASLQKQLAQAAKHFCTIDFNEGLQLFDKRQTAKVWQQKGLAIPKQITEPIVSFEQLLAVLKQQGLNRVFIKLAHGSGASGAIALAISKTNMQAITTIEMADTKQGLRFYNSSKLIRYNDWQTTAMIIDKLVQWHDLQIEAWIPKANYQGKVFDIRVVVINGQAKHTLIRLGKQAITNLHLGNGRGDLEQIKNYLGNSWQLVPELAEQAMHCFPNSLYAGVDILVSQNNKKPYLLEANTFGDFHPNTYYQGLDTYQAELLALLTRHKIGTNND
ncbi:STM4014 family protein [Entomomonas asaccharolytica]|uniref:STM4014 family protein n=2 Tax=Entomomonas asaccharolytica TaxID=2785331 RepID=A0A974RXB3_9GAMM|nr:STM4014 family protein [Entomomonas asaccharolytica]QQP86000.1 STM4014 family protein [Entomomonas asaccharolytica]